MRLIEICGHTIDLKRVQAVGPVENGRYSVTLVSGWELKAHDAKTARDDVVRAWGDLCKRELGGMQ